MIRFVTESGAVYLMDTEARRLMREAGPFSPGIDYTDVPDAAWHEYLYATTPTTGERMEFLLFGGRSRITTPLVELTGA